jgi:6-phosphogluconolactonase (cycloisomerase 2 family)
LASFNITAFNATPAAGSPYNAAVAIWSCAYSRDGAYLYLGDGDINAANLAGFSMNASTGVLTALPGSPFESGAATPLALATDNAGRLFVGDFNANPNQLRAFTTSGGVPSAVTGNPFTSGLTDSYHGVWHPAGFYMVADQAGSRVGVYLIGGSGISTTLTAVSGSPFASGGISTSLLALSETGEFLFAANITSRNLTSFGVNPGNGALVALTQPANTLGNSGFITGLAFAPLEYYQVYLPLVRK